MAEPQKKTFSWDDFDKSQAAPAAATPTGGAKKPFLWSDSDAPGPDPAVMAASKARNAQPTQFEQQRQPGYYSNLALQNSPSGADPHNPGNPNLNAVPQSERGKVNDRALGTQLASIGGGPFAEAAVTQSVKPLIPVAKSVVGGLAGKYLGREAGGVVGHPEAGATIGGIAGSLYGLTGQKIPSKEEALSFLKTDAERAEEGFLTRGKDMMAARRQQPEAFMSPEETDRAALEARGKDTMAAMRQQPEAFGMTRARGKLSVAPPSTPPSPEGVAAPEADVIRVPEPRQLFPGEKVGYNASTPRKLLLDNALQGRPGAAEMLRNAGKTPLFVSEGGYAPPKERITFGEPKVSSPGDFTANRNVTLNPVGETGARPLNPANQFESSFGPEHKEVGDLAEWETGNREGVRPKRIIVP